MEGPLPALSGVHLSILHAYLRIYAKGSLLCHFSRAIPLPLSLFLPPSPFFITVVCIETNTRVKGKQNSKRIMFYEISHPILEVKLLLRELYRYFAEPCLKVTVLCYEFLPKVFQVYRSLRQTCIQGKLAPGQDPGPAKLDMVIISLFCFQWEGQSDMWPSFVRCRRSLLVTFRSFNRGNYFMITFFFLFSTSIKGYSNHLVIMTWYTNDEDLLAEDAGVGGLGRETPGTWW